MLSVYLYLHFRQSFISVAVCIPKYRHWKGKGFRAEYSPQEEDSARNDLSPDLSTFKGWCTTFADEQRKGANDGIEKLIYRRLMIDLIQILPCNNEKSTPFCSFIKKLYLCVSGVMSLVQNNKELWNRNGCIVCILWMCAYRFTDFSNLLILDKQGYFGMKFWNIINQNSIEVKRVFVDL